MPITGSSVDHAAFVVVIWLFYGLAMSSMISRVCFSIYRRRTLQLDDCSVLFSSATLTAATAILHHYIPSIFLADAAVFHYGPFRKSGITEASRLQLLNTVQLLQYTSFILSFVTIYVVKLGFLFFFRCLVHRITLFERMWKGALVSIILSLLFTVLAIPLLWETRSTKDGRNERVLVLGIVAMVLDILTDLFILAIPICVLWQVRMELRQKLGFASFLCLNGCMIILTIVRLSHWHHGGKFDAAWSYLWQQIGACVAVTTLSLTAFRSVFVGSKHPIRAGPWIPSTRRRLGLHKKSPQNLYDEELDQIMVPRAAALTGTSRAARSYEEETDSSEARRNDPAYAIRVQGFIAP